MKYTSLFLATILLPAALFGLVLLSVQHFQIDQTIRRNKDLQDRLIERNKRYITQESILSSPGRLRALAETEYDRSQPVSEQNLYFFIDSSIGKAE
ncbi:MAG: hypothetical protein GW949_01340 [Spirochaetales bacterium]|nr:hypothetical protein [Spirochaetales bacterium]